MKILISAAETSSDAHGAELLHALQSEIKASGGALDAFGIGGPKLQAAGLRTIVDARGLLAMGFGEILTRLPRIFGALRDVAEIAERDRPDVAVVIDYPDFHFKLAKKLKALGIPVVYFIPPKVWAWRKGRVRVLRERFARLLCILPFEIAFYAREQVPARYVGNPLTDELPFALTRGQARAKVGIGEQDRVLVAMPGSRPSEIKHHVELMLESIAIAVRTTGKLRVLMPFPATADVVPIRVRVEEWLNRHPGAGFDVRVSQGDAHACMVAADAGLIKSGTSTLEAGLLGCPHTIIYKPHWVTRVIFNLFIRYAGPVGLVNLIADGGPEARPPFLMREILSWSATPQAIGAEVASLFTDQEKRTRIATGLARLRALVAGTDGAESPSRRAALEVLACAREAAASRGGERP